MAQVWRLLALPPCRLGDEAADTFEHWQETLAAR